MIKKKKIEGREILYVNIIFIIHVFQNTQLLRCLEAKNVLYFGWSSLTGRPVLITVFNFVDSDISRIVLLARYNLQAKNLSLIKNV